MEKPAPEDLARVAVHLCTDCDQCRDLVGEASCPFFPELFRLHDREADGGSPIDPAELKKLIDLCNMCGLCPCPNVRAAIRSAKDAFIARDGLKWSIRILEDVRLVGQICGAYPWLANLLVENERAASVLRAVAGIHPDRKLPRAPLESFVDWARERGLHEKRNGTGRKVAYFAGCTAQYLFPAVAKATVEVLQRNGIQVYLPPQKCCGMPSLLEGDRAFTFSVAKFNLQQLGDVVREGYDVVCSCPTCGYLLKNMFSEGAYFSNEYREALKAAGEAGPASATASAGRSLPSSQPNKPVSTSPLLGAGLLRDESYFAPLHGVQRIDVSSHTYDLGEFLRELHRSGELDRRLGPVTSRAAYFAPCHLKEQNIGQPWWDLLGLVPNLPLERVGGVYDCCGLSGIMGFKREFHEVSVGMAARLVEKIKTANPERLVSDCLSCRLQFNQLLPHEVRHPIEILKESYDAYRG
jgi:glycerol-3-phosphate dehydrogenase subunit C